MYMRMIMPSHIHLAQPGELCVSGYSVHKGRVSNICYAVLLEVLLADVLMPRSAGTGTILSTVLP
jgi:hypothetical protein